MMQLTAQRPEPPAEAPKVYEDYPVVMVHPNARKAEQHGIAGTEKRDHMGNIIPGQFWSWGGSSDFMPPVTVQNEDQEAQHYAQGYRRGGAGDAAAFASLAAGASASPAADFQEFPKWVNGVLVQTAQEEAALVGAKAASGESAGEGSETMSKPRHTASPKPPKKPGLKAKPWSPERRAAFEARKHA